MDFTRLIEQATRLQIDPDVDLRCKHFAVILNKNRIISLAANSRRTHPLHKKFNYFPGAGLHAECRGIIKSGIDNHKNNYMVTFRINKKNNLAMGKPCISCQAFLKSVNLTKVYYSNDNGEFEQLIIK